MSATWQKAVGLRSNSSSGVPGDPCLSQSCGSHGVCTPRTGACVCSDGWHGDSCELLPTQVSVSPVACSWTNVFRVVQIALHAPTIVSGAAVSSLNAPFTVNPQVTTVHLHPRCLCSPSALPCGAGQHGAGVPHGRRCNGCDLGTIIVNALLSQSSWPLHSARCNRSFAAVCRCSRC